MLFRKVEQTHTYSHKGKDILGQVGSGIIPGQSLAEEVVGER